MSEVKQSEALRTSRNLRSCSVPPRDARTHWGLAGSVFSWRVRRVRLRDTVVVRKFSIFV